MKYARLIVLPLLFFFFPLFMNASNDWILGGLVETKKVRIGQEIILDVPTEHWGVTAWDWRWYCLDSNVKLQQSNIFHCYVTLTEACRNQKTETIYFEYKTSRFSQVYSVVLWWELEIEQDVIKVTQITLNKTSASMNVGDGFSLVETVLPSNATDKSVSWYSSDNNVATVNNNAWVTAKLAGNATIICRANDGSGVTAKCEVTVKGRDIQINSTNFPDEVFRNYLLNQSYGKDGELTEDEISNVKEMFFPESTKKISRLKGIEYFTALEYLYCSSQQLTILDISNNTALTSLYCSSNQLTSLDVSKNTLLTEIYCDGNQLTSLDVSKCAKLSRLTCHNNQIKGTPMDNLISGLPQNNTNDIHHFSVVNINIENEGNVCTKEQVAAVKVKGWFPCDQYYQEFEGNGLIEPTTIALPETATVAVGGTMTLIPQFTPSNASAKLTWKSRNEAIATVDDKGVVTGMKEGNTFITVETDNGLNAYCKLTVTAPEPIKITIPDELFVSVGQKVKVEYALTPENAKTTVTWKIDDETVATIDSDGFLKGKKANDATVVVATTANGLTSNPCFITVTPVMKGDVNGDGNIDVADISAIINVMSGIDDGSYRSDADVNGDGKVDVADISKVIFIMAELARRQQLSL